MNATCGNFDIGATVSNQLNGITNGFTVTGLSSNTADDCAGGAACTVTVSYGGVERTATVASDESFTVTFSAAQLAAGNDGNGVDDAACASPSSSLCITVVAEVTTPSLGVGYELGVAEKLDKTILCLFDDGNPDFRLSAMLSGNPRVIVAHYQTLEEAVVAMDRFVQKNK